MPSIMRMSVGRKNNFLLEIHIRTKKKFINVVTISAPYIHKNLIIIPELAYKIKLISKNFKFKFFVTLPSEGKEVQLFWKLVKKYKVCI